MKSNETCEPVHALIVNMMSCGVETVAHPFGSILLLTITRSDKMLYVIHV